MNIYELKSGDIVSYGKHTLSFNPNKPNSLEEYCYGGYSPKGINKFLILEIKQAKHDRLEDLHTIKFLVESKVCYISLTQEDIDRFKFYYVNKE